MNVLGKILDARAKANLILRVFGATKIPLLGFVGPRIVRLDDMTVIVRIPLNWRTKNHLNSMYFGVLAAGADTAAGYLAVERIRAKGARVDLVFKDFRAEFLRRATGDVEFRCDMGAGIAELVDSAIRTGERRELVIPVVATVPSEDAERPVARFELTLSLKKVRDRKKG
jgi:acyl-coenzyme A thioesterase PaaI-like protein